MYTFGESAHLNSLIVKNVIGHEHFTWISWAPAGGCKGMHLHPLEFENDDVIHVYCSQVKCTKLFARASGARTKCP